MNEDHPQPSYLSLRVVAVVLLATGLVLTYQTFQIREGGGYSVVGPRFFPSIVSIGLLILGTIFLLRTTLWPDTSLAEQATTEERLTHWPSVLWTCSTLIIYPFAMDSIGYVAATAIFFPVVTRILGSRQPWRDVIVGVSIAVIIYICFTRFLGVRLPPGILPF